MLCGNFQSGWVKIDFTICNVTCYRETNLKIRRARPETWSINSAETASKIKAVVTCEQPNKELYKFEGNIKIGNQEKVALDVEQLLLRVTECIFF